MGGRLLTGRSVRQAAKRLRQPFSQLLRDDSGQGFVEYALIIAIVSIGAVVALGFMTGKINTLFSKAGNSTNGITLAAGGDGGGTGGGGGGGSGGGGSGGPPPPDGTPVDMTGGGDNGSMYLDGSNVSNGPPGLGGLGGAYTNHPPNGVHTNTPCSFTQGSYTFKGIWVNENDLSNGSDWTNNPPGPNNSQNYDWACLDTAPVAPPAPSITSRPSDPTGNTTASHSFEDDWSWVSFECKLDGGSFGACTDSSGPDGSNTASGLAVGPHTFSVRAVDSTPPGGVASGSATDSWTIVLQAPSCSPGIGSGATDGDTMTASANCTGNPTSYTYAWQQKNRDNQPDCGSSSSGWNPFAGPLVSSSGTNQVPAQDFPGNGNSNRCYRVTVTASNGLTSPSAISSPVWVVDN